jgi:hypothetical protein
MIYVKIFYLETPVDDLKYGFLEIMPREASQLMAREAPRSTILGLIALIDV